jgi:hypothetical protein
MQYNEFGSETICEMTLLGSTPAAMQAQSVANRKKFGITSGQILEAGHTLKANLLILGLNRTEHIGTGSHSPWSMAYKIACGASCPVLTMKAAAGQSGNS